jgi:RND family efflux transporter MFP subunit
MNQLEQNTNDSANGDSTRGGSRRWALIAALIILLALCAAIVPRILHARALKRQTAELALPTVVAVSPEPGKAQGAIPIPAEIEPWIDAPIYARASGYLKRWTADIGAQVKQGELLAEIETPELDQELDRTRHELSEAEASLSIATITAKRYGELVKTSSVSEQENAEKQADLAFKSAQVEAARSNLRRLQELKGFARVTAPFSGTITARKADVGDLITAGGSRELFRLAQTNKLRVYAQVPQAMAPSITIGQTAEVMVPEKPNQVFRADVARTAGAISPDSRTMLVELEVDNAKGEIFAGSFAQVRFTGAKGKPPLTLPGNALLFRAEGPQVGIVGPDNKVELRSVKLGRDFGQTIEILSGVTPNDRVILNPSDSLSSGVTVRVAETPASEKKP